MRGPGSGEILVVATTWTGGVLLFVIVASAAFASFIAGMVTYRGLADAVTGLAVAAPEIAARAAQSRVLARTCEP